MSSCYVNLAKKLQFFVLLSMLVAPASAASFALETLPIEAAGAAPATEAEFLDLHWRPMFPSTEDDVLGTIGDRTSGALYFFRPNESSQVAFRMRAEFERQSALLVSGMLCDSAPNVLRRIGHETQGTTPLVILVNNDEQLQRSASALAGTDGRHRFLLAQHNTIWARDYGPTVLTERTKSLIIDATYEADRPNDDTVPDQLSVVSRTQSRQTSLRLPGGNLLTNGRRLCITTTRVQDENPELTQQDIASSIANLYGATTVAILEPLRDEATGHVDMFATFTDPYTVVVGKYDPAIEPENAAILDRNAAALASIQIGEKKLRVERIPMPSRLDNQILTFTNVVYANGVLLVPSYSSTSVSHRTCIRKFYARLLPGWKIRFVEADRLISDGGALHCVVSNLSSLPIEMERPQPYLFTQKSNPADSMLVGAHFKTQVGRLSFHR